MYKQQRKEKELNSNIGSKSRGEQSSVRCAPWKKDAVAARQLARILIQNEQLEQVDTFPYIGSMITEDGECTTEFRTRLNRGQAIEASLQKCGKVTAYRFQRRYD